MPLFISPGSAAKAARPKTPKIEKTHRATASNKRPLKPEKPRKSELRTKISSFSWLNQALRRLIYCLAESAFQNGWISSCN
jgi:hypothetical protein